MPPFTHSFTHQVPVQLELNSKFRTDQFEKSKTVFPHRQIHTDECDIVGLLYLYSALYCSESDIVSSHDVYNTLQASYPEVAHLLTRLIWNFDRKGKVSEGEE